MAMQSVFPINFDLINSDEDQVIFITDNIEGQTMALEIKNTSDKPIKTKAISGNASIQNSHFELVFRPGTLFNTPTLISTKSTTFQLYYDKNAAGEIVPNPDGTLSLYLKAKKELTLGMGEKMVILLDHVRAATSGGTRSTRVLLKYKNLIPDGGNESISGNRELHINIVNHQGRKNIPLHVGFVGHNTIVNNGRANSIRLRISNSSRKEDTMAAAEDSKFVLVLEGGKTTEEWKLATNEQLIGITVEVKYPGEKTVKEENRYVGTTSWVIPFKGLKENESIEVLLTNVISQHPTGHANLFLHYENIPGYWDGTYTTIIEKGPLTFNKGNTGLGENFPEAKLTIVPDANGRGMEVLSPTAGNTHFPWVNNWNYISGNGTIFRDSKNQERMRLNSDSGNLSIGSTDTPAKLMVVPDANGRGVEVISPTSGNTHFPWVNNWNYISGNGTIFRDSKNQERMRLNSDSGNLSIGSTDTPAKLMVVPDANGRGVEVISPTSGNTHFPWVNNWNYISGLGVIFRNQNNQEKMRFDAGSGDLNVGGKVTASGLSVNSNQRFNKIQSGHALCGSHGGGVKEIRINFPQGFGNKPMCVCTVRNEGYYADTYAVTVKYIDTTHFKVNIARMDSHMAGWGQNVRLDWFAFEM